jgi:hypothetical protein
MSSSVSGQWTPKRPISKCSPFSRPPAVTRSFPHHPKNALTRSASTPPIVTPCIHFIRPSSAFSTANALRHRDHLLFERAEPLREPLKRLLDQVEPVLEIAQPLLDAAQPPLDVVQPALDAIESFTGASELQVDLIPALVAPREAGGRSPRLLLGGAGLLEGVVDLDQHRAHAVIYRCQPSENQDFRV